MSRDRITISVAATEWWEILRLPSLARRAAQRALAHKPSAKPREIAIRFAYDDEVAELNRAWRGKNQPTSVLSFSAASRSAPTNEPQPLGDIILALDVVKAEARAQGKTLEAHTTHLIVHGALHLLGFDHQSKKDAKHMEAAEVAILAGLGYGDPYLI